MATYFVSSSGSNTAPYDTWATAATSLATALAAASTSGDIVVIQYNGIPAADSEVSASTTWTTANNISIISATNNGGSSWTPNAMGSAYWLGNSTTNRTITFISAYATFVYGVTFRIAGVTTSNLWLAQSNNAHVYFDTCYMWLGNISASAQFRFGHGGSNDAQGYVKCRNCTFRLAHADQSIRIGCTVHMEDCLFSTSGTVQYDIFQGSDQSDAGGGTFYAIGCDFSFHTNASIIGDVIRTINEFKFIQCKLPTGYTLLNTQTRTNKSGPRVWLFDCSSGDTHGLMEYADCLGSVVQDTGVYYTGTPSAASWKIVTTANCSSRAPFETPWVDWYNIATSAVTPRFEILRNNSTTAYTNAEVWGEFFVKSTSGTTKSTFSTDGVVIGGSAAANQTAGAGLASWTGESGTAWSGKVNTTSTVTPAESGMIRGKICVGIPSATVYVDPVIRTA